MFLQVAVRQEYPLANTQTMLEQAALSFCGLSASSAKAPWGPQSILHLISYTGATPSDGLTGDHQNLKGDHQQPAELEMSWHLKTLEKSSAISPEKP